MSWLAPRGDNVFEDFRGQMSKLSSIDAEAMLYKLASTYCDVGMIDAAIDTLQMSARTRRYRFSAAAKLGRLYRKRGMLNCAADWLQQAVAAPAPTMEAGRAIAYELAETYEKLGHGRRARAVFFMLQAAHADYRDVRQRIDPLLQTPAGS